jgi:hypothetical protein
MPYPSHSSSFYYLNNIWWDHTHTHTHMGHMWLEMWQHHMTL